MIKTYYMSNGNVQLAEHFLLSEFQCKNGTDEIKVSDILISKLEALRSYLGADSVIINSGYRTSDYSVQVGGSENDPHTKGIAADIYAYRNGELISGAEICCAAQSLRFNGIGYMGNAVHVDVRGDEEYYNNHWWGNEQNGENVSDWYSYFGIDRPTIEDEITVSDNSVASAQTYLNQKYNFGISVDNIYGPETRRALIKAFQIETGCVVDGIWGDECRAAANRFAFTKGNKGNLIYVWQCALVCAGYNPNGIDGDFGDGCLSATKDFQDGKCAVDGVVGADTWSAIF